MKEKSAYSKYLIVFSIIIIGYHILVSTGIFNKKNLDIKPFDEATSLNSSSFSQAENSPSSNTSFALSKNISEKLFSIFSKNSDEDNIKILGKEQLNKKNKNTTPFNFQNLDLNNYLNKNIEPVSYVIINPQYFNKKKSIDTQYILALDAPSEKTMNIAHLEKTFNEIFEDDINSNLNDFNHVVNIARVTDNSDALHNIISQEALHSKQKDQTDNSKKVMQSDNEINVKTPKLISTSVMYRTVQGNLDNLIINNFLNKKRINSAVDKYIHEKVVPLMLPSTIPNAETEAEYYNRVRKEQTALAEYISDRYDLEFKNAKYIVEQAYEISNNYQLDPKLVLALVATESSFDPFAQSSAGAKGLTQAIAKWHPEKFARIRNSGQSEFSVSGNLDLGAQILREYMKNYKNNTVLALQQYNGSINDPKRTYSHKVLSIETDLKRVAEKIK